MSSIVTAVFKATIGLLVNKGRDVAAEKLKEGDVTDKKVRDLIIREVEDIKSKLDGLSRKDLLAAVDSFETGLRYLFKGIDAKRSGEVTVKTAEATERIKEEHCNEASSSSLTDAVKTVSLAAENIELANFDETTKNAFSQAKKRFEMAREKATDASNNEALSTFDRTTAIRYRVMATLLESAMETVGTACDLSSLSVKSALENALPECEQCLQKLHSLPAVQNSFKVELEKGLLNIKGRFGKDERREIISTVCQVNRAIYDAQTIGKNVLVMTWPCVDTGEDKVDPLHDERVRKVLRKVGMERYCVTPWSFGQEGEEEHKLKNPEGITTNTHGQFIIADDGAKTLKVFDSNGHFSHHFNPQTDDADTELRILDVATDVESNIYILIEPKKPGALGYAGEVQVYNNADLLYKFPVRRGGWGRLTVSGSKVLVLHDDDVVFVYEQHGKVVCWFGKGEFKLATDITAANDGRVMVMDGGDSSVHLFTVKVQQLCKFHINIEDDCYYHIACHPAGEHVVVAGYERRTDRLGVAIYTTSGEFVRRIQLDEELKGAWISGITVTMEGHIAVLLRDVHFTPKVIVI